MEGKEKIGREGRERYELVEGARLRLQASETNQSEEGAPQGV